jgi:hypothetical protein
MQCGAVEPMETKRRKVESNVAEVAEQALATSLATSVDLLIIW